RLELTPFLSAPERESSERPSATGTPLPRSPPQPLGFRRHAYRRRRTPSLPPPPPQQKRPLAAAAPSASRYDWSDPPFPFPLSPSPTRSPQVGMSRRKQLRRGWIGSCLLTGQPIPGGQGQWTSERSLQTQLSWQQKSLLMRLCLMPGLDG
uniref:Uncharacterized protein n=1 Tax=Aegilops tauschii subsp. strangulata TaxID=200361 RepID=A0A453Q5L7_AEGTS